MKKVTAFELMADKNYFVGGAAIVKIVRYIFSQPYGTVCQILEKMPEDFFELDEKEMVNLKKEEQPTKPEIKS